MIVSVKIRNYVALKQCVQVHNSGLLFSLLAIQWTMFFSKRPELSENAGRVSEKY